MAVRPATNYQVRPAASRDQRQIAHLIQSEIFVHRHLDWRSPLDWIGAPLYLVIEWNGSVVAALACPPDPSDNSNSTQVAWIRLFANANALSLAEAWGCLWQAVQADLGSTGVNRVAVIAMKDWMPDLLGCSGFSLRQQIVMLERREGLGVAQEILPPGVRIRPMTLRDLTAAEAVDAAAFDLLWHNSLAALNQAYRQAVLASVAESSQGVIGFQVSTQHAYGAHLSRLAVRPEAQGQGVGQALVADLLRNLEKRGASHLTVNTQADNVASLALYRRLGFVETGEHYPVYELRVH
jgi:ribosomal-protein-alanine N-acetyltransferase